MLAVASELSSWECFVRTWSVATSTTLPISHSTPIQPFRNHFLRGRAFPRCTRLPEPCSSRRCGKLGMLTEYRRPYCQCERPSPRRAAIPWRARVHGSDRNPSRARPTLAKLVGAEFPRSYRMVLVRPRPELRTAMCGLGPPRLRSIGL
jgi:hypothetical protein